ncbi:MAG: alpha-E domain-containing protein [Pseudomonadota bacterium]
MLSRTAENLYWLSRYVERAESTARLLEMGRRMAMLPGAIEQDEWRSVILASGCAVPAELTGRITEAHAVSQLLLSTDNASSIRGCLGRARANGRAIRTALTQDMWEALNEGWRRLDTVDVRTGCRDLPQHVDWVKTRTAVLRGAADTGMLRNDGHDFYRLGAYLERADMMLRLLDVKYFVLLPETEVIGGGRDHHQWTSVLYANSATRAYHHVYVGDYTPWKIADFLILNRDFPRSLAFSYTRIGDSLDNLSRRYDKRHRCHAMANDMIGRLCNTEMGEIFQQGLHEFVSDAIRFNAELGAEIADAYHF